MAAFKELKNCSEVIHSKLSSVNTRLELHNQDTKTNDFERVSMQIQKLKEQIEKAKKLCKANLEKAFLISFSK
jgi:hypothetical protein